jgi:hypothetical protein
MPEILSNSFKSDITRLFLADAKDNQDYYLFVSSVDNFDPADTLKSKNEFLEKTLFAKKIDNADIHFCIPYYPWQVGSAYAEYDDNANLIGQNFYAVVGPTQNDTGDYRVYKCLDNNNGATVSNPPNYNVTTTDQIYKTADGYVWKYMYRISDLEFEAYNALGFIPLLNVSANNSIISPAASTGSTISDVIVENPVDNKGYIVERGGMLGNIYPTGLIQIDPFTTWSQVPNYYTGQYLYTTNPNGVSRLFVIEQYTYLETGTVEVIVGNELLTGLAANQSGVFGSASVQIFPRVLISGDGTGSANNVTAAIGVPNINGDRIESITLLDKGSGYHNVTAEVVDPIYDFDPENVTTTDVRATLRAVLSPDGGHAYNLIDEFNCRNFSFYAYITAEDNTKIGDTNTYGAVGLVRSPSWANTAPTIFDNRIAMTTNDFGKVTANSTITQINSDNEIIFTARVHEVDSTANTIYLAEYMGPYQNNANSGNGDTSLDLNLPFRNETGQLISINTPVANNIVFSEYIQRTGEVYFMEDFFPLARTDLSREEFKFVLEF